MALMDFEIQYCDELSVVKMKSLAIPRIGESIWKDGDEFQDPYIVKDVIHIHNKDGKCRILICAYLEI